MLDFDRVVAQRMDKLEENHQLRSLKKPSGVDFCSNDYLGLSRNKILAERIQEALVGNTLGSTGSRLLRGHSQSVEELETVLADFSGTDSALFFPSGYQANVGLFSCLLKSEAVVFSDELIHASIIDGIRLSGCEKYVWSHNDLGELESLLKQKSNPQKLNYVVVESIYSMRGDQAPLPELAELCEKYNCSLIVDEAHATGLFGKRGSGLVEEHGLDSKVFAKIHTGGKALGVSGAWIAGRETLKQLLVNQSRPFIYSTAPAVYQQVAILESVSYIQQHGQQLREDFVEKLYYLQSGLLNLNSENGIKVVGVGGPVTALVVGDNQKAVAVMQRLGAKGMDVRAVRPPSVPKGEAMLRITCPVTHSYELIDKFINLVGEALR